MVADMVFFSNRGCRGFYFRSHFQGTGCQCMHSHMSLWHFGTLERSLTWVLHWFCKLLGTTDSHRRRKQIWKQFRQLSTLEKVNKISCYCPFNALTFLVPLSRCCIVWGPFKDYLRMKGWRWKGTSWLATSFFVLAAEVRTLRMETFSNRIEREQAAWQL